MPAISLGGGPGKARDAVPAARHALLIGSRIAEYRVNAARPAFPYRHVDGELKEVAWAPLLGSQTAFLQCSELEIEGTRGGCGKILA